MKRGDVCVVPVCPECGHPRCPGCGGCTIHESATVLVCPDCGYRGAVTGVDDAVMVQPDRWGILH